LRCAWDREVGHMRISCNPATGGREAYVTDLRVSRLWQKTAAERGNLTPQKMPVLWNVPGNPAMERHCGAR